MVYYLYAIIDEIDIRNDLAIFLVDQKVLDGMVDNKIEEF